MLFVRDRAYAERKYEGLRDQARLEAQAFWQAQGIDVRFERFGTKAFAEIRQKWQARGRQVEWDWPAVFVQRRRRYPTRWDVAIWLGDELLATALGYASRNGKTLLYLEGVERLPGNYPEARLVIPMVLDATERYARQLGSKSIVVIRPHAKLVQKYEQAGYNRQYVRSLKEYAAVRHLES